MAVLGITAVTKLKHADLWKAAKRLGSQAALARHIGVTASELGGWINLGKCPPKSWTEEKLAKIESKLLEVCDKPLDELFPDELREAEEFLASPKQVEKTIEIKADALIHYASRTTERLSYESSLDTDELNTAVNRVLLTLPERLCLILKLRYGLDGETPHTLDEVGRKIGVGKERVRELEARAIRMIQQPNRAGSLVSFIPDTPPNFEVIDSEVKRKSEMTLSEIVHEKGIAH